MPLDRLKFTLDLLTGQTVIVVANFSHFQLILITNESLNLYVYLLYIVLNKHYKTTTCHLV